MSQLWEAEPSSTGPEGLGNGKRTPGSLIGAQEPPYSECGWQACSRMTWALFKRGGSQHPAPTTYIRVYI